MNLDPDMPPGYFLQEFEVVGGMVCVPVVCAHWPKDQAEAIRLAWEHYRKTTAQERNAVVSHLRMQEHSAGQSQAFDVAQQLMKERQWIADGKHRNA